MSINETSVIKSEPKEIRKIWIAIGTPFQANFFAPLIKDLEKECEFFVTARDHDGIFSILRAKGIDFLPVGRHGGKELSSKLEAYAETIQKMLPIVEREKPDLVLTERWPEAVRVAFGLNIPSWTIFYDERENHVNQMVFPLASKIFTPRFYNLHELLQYGVTDPEKIVWFNGFHTCYLKDEKQSTENPFDELGLEPPVVFVRPEPEFATFFPSHKPVLEKSVELIAKSGRASIAVLPRTEDQRRHYSQMRDVTVLDESMSECPIAHVDVALGAAETMLMEAFVMGKPSVSAIYWPPSKPVIELHRYIPHSTEPIQISQYVEKMLDANEKEAFREMSALLVRSMDNPTRMMIDEIRRINEGHKDIVTARRSRIELFLDIIQSTSLRPLKLTHIMRDANISHNELKKFLGTLENSGLISSEVALGGTVYQATSEGLRVLEDYRGIRQRLFAEQ